MNPVDRALSLAEDAACAGLWELFDRDIEGGYLSGLAARRLCVTCPVLEECRSLAADVRPTSGVWAGRDYTAERQARHREAYQHPAGAAG